MNISQSKPQRVDYSLNRFRQKVATINIDIEQAPDGSFTYESVQIRPGRCNYAGIVDALVSHKYPADKMQALQNNYLENPADTAAAEEFGRMSAWRREAKAIAREIFPDE